MTRPSGWYEDPDDPAFMRYFDGVVWTDRRIPRYRPDSDQSGQSAGGSAQQEDPPAEQVQPGPGGQFGGYKSSWPGARTLPARHASSPQGNMGAPPQQDAGHSQELVESERGQHGSGLPMPPPEETRRPHTPHDSAPTTPDGEELSGWWRRVLARLIDMTLISIVMSPFIVFFAPEFADQSTSMLRDLADPENSGLQLSPDLQKAVTAFTIAVVVLALVYDIVLTKVWGATVGKFVLGIRVRGLDRPEPPTWNEAITRSGVKELPAALGVIPALGFFASVFQITDSIWPLFDQKNQALHDKWAKTYVVKRRGKVPPRRPNASVPGREG